MGEEEVKEGVRVVLEGVGGRIVVKMLKGVEGRCWRKI